MKKYKNQFKGMKSLFEDSVSSNVAPSHPEAENSASSESRNEMQYYFNAFYHRHLALVALAEEKQLPEWEVRLFNLDGDYQNIWVEAASRKEAAAKALEMAEICIPYVDYCELADAI